jgi:hypothetical protein
MNRKQFVLIITMSFAVMCMTAKSDAAPLLFNVSLDTSALVGASEGPFSLNFQLIDGGGTATNTVILDHFDFGPGGALGLPSLVGGAAGSLSSGVTLTDDGPSFFNAFSQAFDPGPTLQFSISLTAHGETGGVPDQFSMGILDGGGFGIPTAFFDAFLLIDIASDPTITTFASDPALTNLQVSAPVVTPVQAVPEPAGLLILGTAAATLFARNRKHRRERRQTGVS